MQTRRAIHTFPIGIVLPSTVCVAVITMMMMMAMSGGLHNNNMLFWICLSMEKSVSMQCTIETLTLDDRGTVERVEKSGLDATPPPLASSTNTRSHNE